jgi:RPA family protein
MENRRLTARKTSVSEIINGKFVRKTGFESSYILTNLGRRLSRVRVLGLIVDKFISPDEKFAAVTLDDGTDTIRCKSFINIKIFDGITPGDLVDTFGKLREYNGEVYVTPEIVRKVNSNFETLRILELHKIMQEQKAKIKRMQELQSKTTDSNELKTAAKSFFPLEDVEAILEAQDIIESNSEEKASALAEEKNKIIKLIDSLDKGEGVDYKTLMKESGLDENKVDFAVQELLESGVCFEPKAGKIKKL